MDNQHEAVARAKQALKAAEAGLKQAERELNRTPRSQNAKASAAVYDWRRQVDRAKTALEGAEKELA